MVWTVDPKIQDDVPVDNTRYIFARYILARGHFCLLVALSKDAKNVPLMLKLNGEMA